jgi:hypothetical protein
LPVIDKAAALCPERVRAEGLLPAGTRSQLPRPAVVICPFVFPNCPAEI